MTKSTHQMIISNSLKTCGHVSLTLTFLVIFFLQSAAQSADQIASHPDRGARAPGSYSGSEIENINLTNGNVNLSIPLSE
jgi:hypothetical protein